MKEAVKSEMKKKELGVSRRERGISGKRFVPFEGAKSCQRRDYPLMMEWHFQLYLDYSRKMVVPSSSFVI